MEHKQRIAAPEDAVDKLPARPLFLLGAGFNVDAADVLGPISAHSIYIGEYSFAVRYPVVADLLKRCFQLDEVPEGKSIEDLFDDAIESKEDGPIEALVHQIREADYYLASQLIAAEGPVQSNPYVSFFTRFAHSDFVTFNYDGLVEIALLRLGRWSPSLGYGVDVEARQNWDADGDSVEASSVVLHLHGSLYVRTEHFFIASAESGATPLIERLPQPQYWFDPGNVADAFRPFVRYRVSGPPDALEQILAPVPNKAKASAKPFVQQAAVRAKNLAEQANLLIAIGYSFNRHDASSYKPILDAVERGGRRVLIVSPDASESKRRLCSEFPRISFQACPRGFADWMNAGCPGVEQRPLTSRMAARAGLRRRKSSDRFAAVPAT